MPQFTIETTYHLPVFRHSTYLAETPDVACRFAIEDTDCSGQREDCESSGEAHVTGIWEGAGAAYRGQAIPVHAHFGEAVQRKAAQFELMLACSRSLSAMLRARRPTPPGWLGKAEWAIARGEAILAGRPRSS
ncbi:MULTISPECIES: hypothetical protein [unclassified Mesorhizobium]|uniref:hypothetical protein n=1 Tax=unclassified Mesorhizobium TaxID=325217 RepID=UPI0003CF6737|nr:MULTISPECIES: hypothetical protein [unclassified Mesorhizobium]ESX86596.1 hypothetical protein X755_29895 [Mesorhizobium sp. LNJC405B00]ESZ57040.1 hypothetical protein X728_24260 [Mesorhizobium sp. L103C120A0]WJI43043.1 hypothetical protein NL532_20520 [Mesorhizobium sp. C120A]